MQPKCLSPTKRHYDPSKIEHQIDNEGCKCGLCQRMVFEEMMVVKQDLPFDIEQEKKEIGVVKPHEPYFIKFLEHLYVFDRNRTRLRLLVPEICLFDKGHPHCLFSKKKEYLPLKLIRNKEKLNYYEIKNFFYQGFTHHNRCPDVNKKQLPTQKVKSSITSEVKDKEAIKNDPIVIARFNDNHGQILSLNMMDSLFKYNQKLQRQSLQHIQTLVSCQNYREIRIKVNLDEMMGKPVFVRAKNQVKIIHEEIKEDEFGFVAEKDEFAFEEGLLKQNVKQFLEYMSLKLVLLNSLSGYKTIWDCCFRWVKGNGNYYYFVDLDVYKFTEKHKVWGVEAQDANIPSRVTLKEKPSVLRNSLNLQPRISNLDQISDTVTDTHQITPTSALKSPMTTISSNSYTSNIENLAGRRSFKVSRPRRVTSRKQM